MLSGRAYPWRAQELATKQRGSGGLACGESYWSRIDQGTAAGLPRDLPDNLGQKGRGAARINATRGAHQILERTPAKNDQRRYLIKSLWT